MDKQTGSENERDEELIERLREGDNSAMDKLLVKYKPLVKSKAKNMYILGAEPEDLLQEGMIGLFKAIKDYDPGRDASFYTFAELCINRNIYNAVSASNRLKHIPLNSYISLSASADNENDPEGQKLLETYADENLPGPEEMVIARENVLNLEKRIDEELSDFEKQVLELHLTGLNYVEIAKILGREEKSTDNALQRIRNKIRRLLLVKS